MNESATLTQILEEQFTLYLTEEEGIKEYQAQANALLTNRKTGFSSDSMTSIINVISSTDIIGIIPKLSYEFHAARLNLKEINIDFKIPSIRLYLMYNRASLSNKKFAEYINTITSENQQPTSSTVWQIHFWNIKRKHIYITNISLSVAYFKDWHTLLQAFILV